MKSHAAGSTSVISPTFAQLGELCRQIDRGDITRNRLQNILRQGNTFDGSAVLMILGYDIIFPEEIMNMRPQIEYSDEQLRHLAQAFPDAKALQWCKEKDCVVMPLPPLAMSLKDIRSLDPDLFDFQRQNCDFEPDPKWTNIGWVAARKNLIPESTSKAMKEQAELLDKQVGEVIPNPAEFAWIVTTYWKVRRIHLFDGCYTRSASTGWDSNTINIGSSAGHIRINPNNWGYWDCVDCLGLEGIRKFRIT
jgi:hypothetical protein